MKRTIQKLPESELDIMLVLWKQKSDMSRSEIEKIVNQKKTLAPTTILTLLSRLEKKGFVSIKRVGNLNKYHWLVSQEEYQQKEGKGMLEKLYGNSVKNFVAAMYQGKEINEEDLKELEGFLKELNH
ncbi:BlaI/MecI/CopY family transcriptional regulator [Lacrimispora saccharolytica]|nr:BlaI/MecI/CopY family transcriptional regulator [Lachnospiraceae bacterium]MDM8249972.1 BlaI/MecI/CopY family transcriptional regulator [Lacrimispora saccharolytica]